MSNLELQIDNVVYAAPSASVQGRFKAEVAAHRLRIFGWALAHVGAVSAIEVAAEGDVVATAKTGISRPDVGRQFSAHPSAATSGFAVVMEAEGEGRSELAVEAVMESGERHRLGKLEISMTVGERSSDAHQESE